MKIRTQLITSISLLMALMLVLGIAIKSSIHSLKDSMAWVAHTHEVIGDAQQIGKLLVEMETSVRGFLITGDESFLPPYFEGEVEYAAVHAELTALVSDNPQQVARLTGIDHLSERWQAQVAIPRIQARREGKTNEDIQEMYNVVRSGSGTRVMTQLRADLNMFIQVEKKLLKQRLDQRVKVTQRNNITIGLGIFLYICVAIAALWITMRNIMRQLGGEPAEIAAITNRIAAGDLDVSTGDGDGIGILASVKIMLQSLRDYRQEMDAQNWLKTGLAQLNEVLSGDQTLASLASKAISELTTYCGAQIGTFYILDEATGTLSLKGSYAYKSRKNLSNRFRMGEGLVGQAALEQQQILIKNIPEDYIRISSQLGEKIPRFICVSPCLHEGQVKGVIEIGSFTEFSEQQLEYLSKAVNLLGLAIESAAGRTRLASELEISQTPSEKLQTQQEELRVSNEELEEQTHALQLPEEELKNQQEELQTINEELEEKTESLERQKVELVDAATELEAKAAELTLTNKYKSEFLANMSHELRTPLNSLLILANMLTENKEGNLTADQVESAEVIHGCGKDLLSLINEILDLAKIEAGQTNLHIETVSISTLAEETRKGFQHVFDSKGLQFAVTIEEGVPDEILSDGKRIGQILKNLISNAGKFTDKGSVTVTFKNGTLQRNPSLIIAVADTGTGIPADKQKIVFEAFQQADGGTARKYGGTGLGLSISRELARVLGGEIHLKSEDGKGSTFSLYLPLNAESEDGEARTETPAPTLEKNPRSTVKIENPMFGAVPDDRDNLKEKETVILVIEDDASFAKILLQQCHEKGLKCLIASTGEEGLYLAENQLPNAIILDLKLPGIDGWSVLDQLKEKLATRHIPVHIMSAEEPARNALNNGAIGFLNKAAGQDDLHAAFARIEDLIERKMKDLLVIEDDSSIRHTILKLIGNSDVIGVGTATGQEALELLRTKKHDCIILDLNLADMTGFEFLKLAEADEDITLPPIIVYTGKDLTREEEALLVNYSDSIIIKGVRSQERLFDEASLFLHRMVEKMPEKKRTMIANLHDANRMFLDKKVLIVDDDMRNLFALSNSLSAKGIQTIKAQDGQKALDELEKNPSIELVLMDIMMPGMDGYETMSRIRQQKRFEHLPIIALTAKAMKADRQKCIDAGANDYLSKPIEIDRLLSMMRVWMYR